MRIKETFAGVGLLGLLVLGSSSCSEDVGLAATAPQTGKAVPASVGAAPEIEEVPLDFDTLRNEAFVTVVGDEGVSEVYARAMLAEGIPVTVCEALELGASPASLVYSGMTNGDLTPEQAGAVVGASIGGWCPHQEYQL